MITPGSILLEFSEPAEVSKSRGRTVSVRVNDTTIKFPDLGTSLLDALRKLKSGATDDELAAVAAGNDVRRLTRWYHCLATIQRHGGITYTALHGGTRIARAVVLSDFFTPGETIHAPGRMLSRFAYLRRLRGHSVLETPLAAARVELLHPLAVSLVTRMVTPTRASDLRQLAGPGSETTIADLRWLLEFTSMVTGVGFDGVADEDRDPRLKTWHFADLLFHARSRGGRHDDKFEVFKHRKSMPFLPPTKAPMSSSTIDLFVPDMKKLARTDTRLTRAIEDRRSERKHGRRPLTARQLGEFLYRVARVKRVIRANGRDRLYDASRRPYPGGGAAYELELYIVVNRCTGLQRGIYHYDPRRHRLEWLDRADEVDGFVRDARTPLSIGERHVLIVMGARFQRMTWKYNASTYAPILKNVGVVIQTMYLVATAMGLAPCALGSGNSERFARAMGTDYLEESSVGEFMLGRR